MNSAVMFALNYLDVSFLVPAFIYNLKIMSIFKCYKKVIGVRIFSVPLWKLAAYFRSNAHHTNTGVISTECTASRKFQP